ncbi:L-lactate dehydrogenase [Fusarium oxysporum f. sp. albedinis]|nr:L-lactate dehydrogenase [Fusarium oxysporum f. sp. albedinis]
MTSKIVTNASKSYHPPLRKPSWCDDTSNAILLPMNNSVVQKVSSSFTLPRSSDYQQVRQYGHIDSSSNSANLPPLTRTHKFTPSRFDNKPC